ncbi:MAG: PTS sugar transporter subunit IIA [Deltaproteobacteria bacterium]|nr:PTS sugar transporter subunit IIA [Deltaproteobacteria bacterium]
MKLIDILPETLLIAELKGTTKDAVLRELAERLAANYPEIDAARLLDVLWERERLGSTAIGDGIAIPHGKLSSVKGVIAAFGRHTAGVNFDSLDGKPTRLIFLLVAPAESVGLHLKALARVSRLLKEVDFRQRLLTAPDESSLYRAMREEDEKY